MNRHGAVHMPGQTPFKILTIGFDNVEAIDARLHPAQQETWHEIRIHDLIPIPLTQEWLHTFGFERQEHSTEWRIEFRSEISSADSLVIYQVKPTKFMFGIGDMWINHVHQLQNLFFSLTGQELKIEDTVSSN